jgi:hypothetical protein
MRPQRVLHWDEVGLSLALTLILATVWDERPGLPWVARWVLLALFLVAVWVIVHVGVEFAIGWHCGPEGAEAREAYRRDRNRVAPPLHRLVTVRVEQAAGVWVRCSCGRWEPEDPFISHLVAEDAWASHQRAEVHPAVLDHEGP